MSLLDESFDSIRTEVQAAIDAVDPQVRGLDDLTKVSLSPAALDAVRQSRENHTRRRDLLSQVLQALDMLIKAIKNLLADGYPNMPNSQVEQIIYEELQQQLADLLAALKQFGAATPQASTLTLSLGSPATKP